MKFSFTFKVLSMLLIICLIKAEVTQSADSSEHLRIFEVNDSNFDNFVQSGKKFPWLVVFFINSCPHCKSAKSVLTNISQNPDSVNKSNIKLATIDCDRNMFTCYRFKISRVPYITIFENNLMYEFNEHASQENLVRFILIQKYSENGLPIPPVVGYLEFFMKSMEELVGILNNALQNFVESKFNIKMQWKSEYTIGIMVLLLLFVVIIEVIVLSYICRRKPKKEIKDSEKNKSQEKNSDKNNKKNN